MGKIDEAIKKFQSNAEYERTHGNLQGFLEFRQLAKWLRELRAYRNMYYADNVDNCLREKSEPTVEVIPKADYEARLRADMAAMLTDIKILVAELDFTWMCDYADGDCIKRYAVVDIIQEKINALKGDQAAG